MTFIRMAALGALALTLAACSSTKEPDAGLDAAAQGAAGTGVDSERFGRGAEGVRQGLRSVGDTVYFGTDSYSVGPDGEAVLRQQAELLMANPEVFVRIEGHADERGTREYNIALGDRRANAVKDVLVSYGVERNRIRVVSFGKDRPSCGESSEGCWQQNRRATTAVAAAGS
jgi:peptidoglycan-associated lipoprotein